MKLFFLVLSLQLGASFILSLVVYPISHFTGVLSVLTGASIAILSNSCFLFTSFRYVGARFSKIMVRNFIWGEIIKIILISSLFTLIFIWFAHAFDIFNLFLGFILVYISPIFLLVFFQKNSLSY